MHGKRGEDVSHLLMSYGWVLALGLIGLTVLVMFDVVTPGSVLPESCKFSTQLGCEEFIVGEDGVSLTLANLGSQTVILQRATFTSDALAGECTSRPINRALKQGDFVTIIANEPDTCTYVGNGEKARYSVKVDFVWRPNSLSHFIQGELLGKKASGTFVGTLEGEGKAIN